MHVGETSDDLAMLRFQSEQIVEQLAGLARIGFSDPSTSCPISRERPNGRAWSRWAGQATSGIWELAVERRHCLVYRHPYLRSIG